MADRTLSHQLRFYPPEKQARTNRVGRKPLLPVADGFDRLDDPRLGITDMHTARLVAAALSRFIGNQRGQRGANPRLGKLLACLAHLPYDGSPPFDQRVPLAGWPSASSVYGRAARSGKRWRNSVTVDDAWSLALGLDGIRATLPLQLVVEMFPAPLWPGVAEAIQWGPRELARRTDRALHLAAAGDAPGFGRLSRDSLRLLQSAPWAFMETLVQLEEGGYPSELLRHNGKVCLRHREAGLGATDGCPDCDTPRAWTRVNVPRRTRIRQFSARVARTDRTAPSHHAILQAHEDLQATIDSYRQTTSGQHRLQKPLRNRSLLEFFIVFGGRVEAISLIRKGPWERRDNEFVQSLEWGHGFLDGTVGLGIGLFPGKSEDNLDDDVLRWKLAPARTAAHFNEYWNYVGLDDTPDGQPVWFGDWEYFLIESGERIPRPNFAGSLPPGVFRKPSREGLAPSYISNVIATLLEPYADRRYSTHTLRRYAHQMGVDAAEAYLKRNPTTRAKITAETIVKCLLDHALSGMGYLYNDLDEESVREKWAGICAAGIEDLVLGPEGKKKDIDRARILSARQHLEEARADFAAATAERTRIEAAQRRFATGADERQRDLDALIAGTEKRMASLRDSQDVLRAQAGKPAVSSDREWRELQIELGRVESTMDTVRDEALASERRYRDAIDREKECLGHQQRDLTELLLQLQDRIVERQRDLESACAARVPISAHEPSRSDQDLLDEIDSLLNGVERRERGQDPESERPEVRDWLTPAELAGALGVPASTLRAMIARARRSSTGLAFAAGDRRNPWNRSIHDILAITGERSRRFVFSKLDLSHYHPAQIRAMREVLRTPAGGNSEDEPSPGSITSADRGTSPAEQPIQPF